jgi:tetratricopeptide (TPR) repeat protein
MLCHTLVNVPPTSLLLLALLAAGPARAQPGAAPISEPTLEWDPVTPRKVAHQHFNSGVELAGRGEYEPALAEFLSAYQAFPNFVVLYNIGQAYILLGRPIEAIDTLEQYLREGNQQIAAARVERTVEQIAAQRTQVAELRVAVSVASAAVEIDGRSVGASPMVGPLRVDPGTHLISVRAPDRPPLLRSVTVSAGQRLDLAIELPAAMPLTLAAAPAPAAPADRAAASHAVRGLSYVLGGAGVALGVAALGHYLWNRERYDRWRSEQETLGAERVAGSYGDRQQINDRLSASIDRAEPVTWLLALSGAACLTSVVVLFVIDGSGAPDTVSRAGASGLQVNVRGTW